MESTLHPPLGFYLAGFEGHEASACTDPITRLEIAHDSVFHQDVFDVFVGGDVEASSQTRYVESDHVCRIVFEWVGLVIHRLNGRVFSTNQTPGATKNFMVP